jgi:hypothetical protein
VAANVIYFPRIDPPESEWFTRALLYWDVVGAIVPLFDSNSVLDERTRRLVDVGLVRPIVPLEYIGSLRGFEESFLALLESDQEVRARRGQSLDALPIARIHMEKFGDGLAEELVARGLARRAEHWGWLEVEQRTGHLFMTYLATALGRLPELDMTPITDLDSHLKLLFAQDEPAGSSEQAELQIAVVSEALPAPSGPVPPEELAKFKDANRQLLQAFRLEVTRSALESTAAAPGARRALAELKGRELAGMAEELTRQMRGRRWQRIGLGALAVVGAGAAAADAFLSGGALTQTSAVTGLLGAALGTVDQGRQVPFAREGVAYAVSAARAFADGATGR